MASANCKLMWHEARQQEKFVQKMLVDYRKRAERRKEYYEKIVSIIIYYIYLRFCPGSMHYCNNSIFYLPTLPIKI